MYINILICSIFKIIIRNSFKEGDNFIDNKITNKLAYRLMVNNNSPTLSTYVEKLETYAFILHRGHYSNFIFQET